MGRRWRVAAIATVLLLSGQIPTAQVVRASADPVTVVVLDSAPGEYIGQGRAHTFTGSEIVAGGGLQTVDIHLDNGSFTHYIHIQSSQPLVVGSYENATWNGDPQLSVTLGSTGSSGIGRFDVLQAPVLDVDSHLQSVAIDFSMNTNGDGKLLYGQIRINSTVPVKALDVDVPGGDDVNAGSGTVMAANAAIPIMVTNVGNEALSLDSLTVGGTNPASFLATWSCPAVLAPGASCSVSLVFRPALGGNNQAVVTIGTDALHWGRWFHPYGTATFADAPNMTPATAIVIPSLPFGHAGALNPDTSSGGWIACPGDYGSLWYRYTTSVRKRVQLDPAGGSSTEVMVMAGSASVAPFACSANSPLTFTAEPGVQYWIRLQHKYDGGGGAALVLQATEGEPDTTVEASGLGVNYPTFYPYVDSYKDTVRIKGTRAEKAWVAIGIYNPTGSQVRSLSVAAGTGAWAVTWNGRTSAGTALPAGKYRVVQTVTDMWGNKLSATSYTTVSWKRLYTYTYSKTIDAAAYAAYGKSGTGSISKAASSYTGGVRISTGTGGGTAAVGYAFTAPAATIYKSVTFKALGRGPMIAGGFAETGVQDWTICTSWSINCVSPWGPAPRAYGWAGVWASGSHHVSSGRSVRGYLHVWTFGGLTWLDARDVRITIVYGVLK